MAKKKNTKKPYSERQKLSLIVGSIGLALFLITGYISTNGPLAHEGSTVFKAITFDRGEWIMKTNYFGIVGLALAVGGAVGFLLYKDE